MKNKLSFLILVIFTLYGCTKDKFKAGDHIITIMEPASNKILKIVGASKDHYVVFKHFESHEKLIEVTEYTTISKRKVDENYSIIESPKNEITLTKVQYAQKLYKDSLEKEELLKEYGEVTEPTLYQFNIGKSIFKIDLPTDWVSLKNSDSIGFNESQNYTWKNNFLIDLFTFKKSETSNSKPYDLYLKGYKNYMNKVVTDTYFKDFKEYFKAEFSKAYVDSIIGAYGSEIKKYFSPNNVSLSIDPIGFRKETENMFSYSVIMNPQINDESILQYSVFNVFYLEGKLFSTNLVGILNKKFNLSELLKTNELWEKSILNYKKE